MRNVSIAFIYYPIIFCEIPTNLIAQHLAAVWMLQGNFQTVLI